MKMDVTGILRLRTTRLILKNDLQYVMTEEEKAMFEVMSEHEIQMIRKNFLSNIRNGILYLDVLEEELIKIKDEEYIRYLNNEGKGLDIETQIHKKEELESKCWRMLINIEQERSNSEDLLGPDIHETYGKVVEKII